MRGESRGLQGFPSTRTRGVLLRYSGAVRRTP
nr:MAG TPA: hypothetical protein [Caudoviricetes sp.]